MILLFHSLCLERLKIDKNHIVDSLDQHRDLGKVLLLLEDTQTFLEGIVEKKTSLIETYLIVLGKVLESSLLEEGLVVLVEELDQEVGGVEELVEVVEGLVEMVVDLLIQKKLLE